ARAIACGACLALPLGSPLDAQAVGGSGTDARQLPAGAWRYAIGGIWDGHSEIAENGTARPYLGRLATDAFGSRHVPQLAPAEAAIRTLAGAPSYSLSLGPLEALGDARQSIAPITIERGLTRRLSLSLTVPYVESRDNARLILNRDGTGANVGQNTAYTSAAVRLNNGTILRQFALARASLAAEIARCTPAAAANCDAIRANPSSAQQLLLDALAAQNALATLYGDSVRAGSPVVPIVGSSEFAAITARIGTLRSAFASLGISAIDATSLPAAATFVNGPGGLPRMAKDSAYGLNYDVLGGTRRAGIGDIDLTASYLLINTVGDRPVDWINTRRFGVRSQLTGGWRFGTAGADRTNTAFDVPIGDGAAALLVRSTTDVVFSSRFWMSGTVRLVQPLSDNAVLRRPLYADSSVFFPTSVGRATRSLGRRAEVEVVPRVVIGRFFALTAGYQLAHNDASSYAFDATDSLPAETLTIGSRTAQSMVLGFTFSTLSSYLRNRAKFPLEVFFTHVAPVTASGDRTPRVATDRLELRIYTDFPRR
ncbi:MAG: hypothetical protein IT353_17175, partial [Gemmatimonadaceae bacterium]|nr:hypothetical protein [Gemmatimonadaceae bacterium]